VSEKKFPPLSWEWLTEIYSDSGLDPAEAEGSAEKTWRRLVTRTQRPHSQPGTKKMDIRGAMIADPMVSFHRITGTGMSGLPFYDDETGSLNPVELTFAMRDAGISTEVALAFAKVVVEICSPEGFFSPVWNALGQSDPVDLDVLRRMDWSPLRAGIDLSAQEGGPVPRQSSSMSHPHKPLLSELSTAPVHGRADSDQSKKDD